MNQLDIGTLLHKPYNNDAARRRYGVLASVPPADIQYFEYFSKFNYHPSYGLTHLELIIISDLWNMEDLLDLEQILWIDKILLFEKYSTNCFYFTTLDSKKIKIIVRKGIQLS